MNRATGAVRFFQDEADLERFGVIALELDAVLLEVVMSGARATGNSAQQVLMVRLASKMMEYRVAETDRATPQAQSRIAEVDAEIEALWPTFKAALDSDIKSARELAARKQATQHKKPH